MHTRLSPALVPALATMGLALALAPLAGQTQDGTPPLGDARIAHIAVTANAIDVEMGELARERSADERVRRFAETMIRDHTAVNEQAAALAQRLGVTPADNPVSRDLRSGAEAARAALESADGAGFDAAYIQREVEYHAAVLKALDETLIPGVQNDELRALLEQARAAIAGHLEQARALRGQLGGA